MVTAFILASQLLSVWVCWVLLSPRPTTYTVEDGGRLLQHATQIMMWKKAPRERFFPLHLAAEDTRWHWLTKSKSVADVVPRQEIVLKSEQEEEEISDEWESKGWCAFVVTCRRLQAAHFQSIRTERICQSVHSAWPWSCSGRVGPCPQMTYKVLSAAGFFLKPEPLRPMAKMILFLLDPSHLRSDWSITTAPTLRLEMSHAHVDTLAAGKSNL